MRGKLVSSIWQHDPAADYVPARHRRACRYDAFVPDAIAGWVPDLHGELAGLAADAQAATAALERESGPLLQGLARLLLRTEAIASSKIEGMQVGTRELARAEARHDLGAKVGAEASAILAGIDAMQFAIDEAASAATGLTLQRICAIHDLLMRDAAPWTTPGRIREVQNWIGGNDFNPCGADFVPPPPEEVGRLVEDLCQASSDDALPGVVQCAIVHAQFETIHPFNDGNGRVGRSLIHVLLRRRGLVTTFVPPVSVVLANRRDRYVDTLTKFRNGEPDAWIEMFSIALSQSVTLAARYVSQVRALHQRWHDQVAALPVRPRSDAAVWALLEQLPAHPVLTGPAAVASTGRSKPAINQAIGQLVEASVLEPLSTGARNRSWEVQGLLALVEQLERG